MNQKKLKPHVEEWVKDGLLQPDQAEKILSRYPHSGTNYWMIAFAVIGSTLILGGFGMIISSNWQSIPDSVKFISALLLLAASMIFGIEAQRRNWARAWWECAYLAAAILPVLIIGLTSQIFHVQGKATNLMIVWVLMIVPVTLFTRSVSAWVVQILAVMSLFICAADEKFLGQSFQFDDWCVGWMFFGAALSLVSQLWAKLRETVQRDLGEFWGILIIFIAGYAWGLESDYWPLIWLVLFLASLGLIYRGYLYDKAHQVNIGFVMVALVLLSVFFRIVEDLADTGLIFVGGGIVIILTVWLLNRLRKKVLDKSVPADQVMNSDGQGEKS